MAHRIDSLGEGRARVTIDLNGASLDADALPIGASWVTLTNMLSDLPGVLRKRGAITDAGGNTTDINDASGALAFYDGPLRSGVTLRPYSGVCNDAGAIEWSTQYSSSGRQSSGFGATGALPVSKLPVVNDCLLIVGREAASATYPNRAASDSLIYSGGSTTGIGAGTATMTSGSAIVTGSGTSWTSAIEGIFFSVDTDTSYRAFYIVKSVVSTTSLILDRPYAGSATGAGLAISGSRVRNLHAPTAGPWGVANSIVACKVAAAAWGRIAAGSTREAGATGTPGSSTPEYRSRIRWSGLIGSDDGAGAVTGMYAWHVDGYVDLASTFGEILALVPLGDALLAFQESGLTVLRGAPVYDGAGSLDASEVHRGVAINGGFAFESTPEGVFFFDKNVGPCVYDGQRVQRIGDKRVTRTMIPYGITACGYYDGKVVFSGTTTKGLFVFDTATGQWTFHDPGAAIHCLIAGRVEQNEDLVGLGSGTQVVNVTNMFDAPGVAASDWDGTSIIADIKTGKLGDAITHLRPERMYVTYRLTDLTTTNPYLTTTTTTGLPDTSATNYTYSNAATELIETTDVETKVLELNLQADPMMQLRVLQVNGAGKLEIFSVVIDCTVEGEGASN